MSVLPQEFYLRQDVLLIARELIGKILYTRFDGRLTGGRIVETEAYAGETDRASHAFGGRRTGRTEVMYLCGGISYIYLCYGLHHLFNVVTAESGTPHAVLVRALEPVSGQQQMTERRKHPKSSYALTNGPGILTQALGIRLSMSGCSLQGPDIWIEEDGFSVTEKKIQAGPRVGVEYAVPDAALHWRFRLRENPWCSLAK